MTAVHLGSFLNFAQLACTAKFKIEPKCAAVKVTPLTEVASEVILNWTWVFLCTCSVNVLLSQNKLFWKHMNFQFLEQN